MNIFFLMYFGNVHRLHLQFFKVTQHAILGNHSTDTNKPKLYRPTLLCLLAGQSLLYTVLQTPPSTVYKLSLEDMVAVVVVVGSG